MKYFVFIFVACLVSGLDGRRGVRKHGKGGKHGKHRTCEVPAFHETLAGFRKFPNLEDEKPINGYDAFSYDSFLEEFYNQKDGNIRDALEDLGASFLTQLLADRYTCRGTKFNQLLIFVIGKESKKFMSSGEAMEFKDVITGHLEKLKGAENLPNKIVDIFNKTIHMDMMGYLEEEEFKDVKCFIRRVKGTLKKAVAGGATLEEIKNKFANLARRFPDIFTCTEPSRILAMYRTGYEQLKSRGFRYLIVGHLKNAFRELFMSKHIRKLQRMMWFTISRIFPVVRDSITKLVNPLRAALDITELDQFIKFLSPYIPDEKLLNVEKFIESLQLYNDSPDDSTDSPATTEAPAPGTDAPAPGTDAPAPGTDAPAPGTDAPAPGTDAPAPGTDAPAPGTEAPAPGTEAPAPGTEAPVPGTDAPAPGTDAPAPGTEAPAPGTEAPAPGTEAPAPGTEAPVPGTEAPAPGTEAPTPSPEQEKRWLTREIDILQNELEKMEKRRRQKKIMKKMAMIDKLLRNEEILNKFERR